MSIFPISSPSPLVSHSEQLPLFYYTWLPMTLCGYIMVNSFNLIRSFRFVSLISHENCTKIGGTLKIYGESLCRDVPYKTLLLSIRDCAQAVVREMLSKYGLDKADPLHYCLVQVNSDGTEYILDDDECPLSILMNHPTSRGSYHIAV